MKRVAGGSGPNWRLAVGCLLAVLEPDGAAQPKRLVGWWKCVFSGGSWSVQGRWQAEVVGCRKELECQDSRAPSCKRTASEIAAGTWSCSSQWANGWGRPAVVGGDGWWDGGMAGWRALGCGGLEAWRAGLGWCLVLEGEGSCDALG